MVKCLPEFEYFTVFLKNRNFISKIRRSKVTDYAALRENETFCTVLLTSQVVMIQSLQPIGREFESTCVLFLPLFDSLKFIYYRCTTPSE